MTGITHPIDRRLIALLRADGRASVTKLAAELGVSRATIVARMDRLVASGTIVRFTVDLREDPDHLVRAVMMIKLQGKMSRAVVRSLRRIPEIRSLYSTNGTWDLVAEIQTETLPRFDRILREVREIPGVTDSETSLLLDNAGG